MVALTLIWCCWNLEDFFLDFAAGNGKKDDPQFSHKDYNLWFNMAYDIKKKQQLSQLKSPKSKKVPCILQHDSVLIITQLTCHKFCVQNVCHNNVFTSLIWQSLRNLSLSTICTDSLMCFYKLLAVDVLHSFVAPPLHQK